MHQQAEQTAAGAVRIAAERIEAERIVAEVAGEDTVL